MINLKDGLVTIDLTHNGKTLSGTMSFDTFHSTLSAMFDEQELAAARTKVAEIEARLGIKAKPQAVLRAKTEIDETDAGHGIREEVNGVSAEDFRGELHVLRQRALERRARREH